MDDASGFGSFLGAVVNGIGLALEYEQNEKNMQFQAEQNALDRQWQEYVQNTTWEREDNAVQRRMADLQAAGLNPNLAAGSAAGAGAVVGRSNSPAVQSRMDYGSLMDFARSIIDIKREREQTELLKKQQQLVDEQIYKTRGESNYLNANLMPKLFENAFLMGNYANNIFSTNDDIKNLPYYRLLSSQYDNTLIQNQMNNIDLNWYRAEKILNTAQQGMQIMSPFIKPLGQRIFDIPEVPALKNYNETYLRTKHGYTRSREYY